MSVSFSWLTTEKGLNKIKLQTRQPMLNDSNSASLLNEQTTNISKLNIFSKIIKNLIYTNI